LADRIDALPADLRPTAMAALTASAHPSLVPVLAKLARHPDLDTRAGAYAALGRAGGREAAAALCAMAAGAPPEDLVALESALADLRGADVDALLVDRLTSGSADARVFFAGVIARRGAASARPALHGLLATGEAAAAAAAADALGDVGDAESCRSLLRELGVSPPRVAPGALHKAIGRIALRDPAGAAALLAALPDTAPQTHAELLDLLPAIGGTNALAQLTRDLGAPSDDLRRAALRALGEWKTAAPLEAVLAHAERAGDAAERALAARGAAGLLKKATDRSPEDFGNQVARALAAAPSAAEKRSVLGSAAAVPSAAALEAVQPLLADAAIVNEAASAIAAMAPNLPADAADAGRSALRAALGRDVVPVVRQALLSASIATGALKNIALGARADSPDGLEKDGAAGRDEAAIDGDPGTYWDEVDQQKEYRYRVTLPSPARLQALIIQGYQHHQYAPRDFDILVDGRIAMSVTNAEYAGNRLLVPLPPGTTGSAVELAITGSYGASPAMRELEIYGEPEAAAPPLAWRKGERALALLKDGRPVWAFHAEADAAKPYFDPVSLGGGASLTWKSPPDHPWHHGLWFCWKFINGVNYWEEDRKTGRSEGATAVDDVFFEERPDFSARIGLTLRYAPAGATGAVLTEQRMISISPPAEDGSYRMDWTLRFTAGAKEVKLDRTPPPPEQTGKASGGYAGLSVRFALAFTNWQIAATRDIGPFVQNRHVFRAEACDYSGDLDGLTQGVAILDHPQNLHAPSPWYVVCDPGVPFSFLSPAVIRQAPHVMAPGSALTLRYRLAVHPGRWDGERLRKECDAFSRSDRRSP
jgi:hypothetical protein